MPYLYTLTPMRAVLASMLLAWGVTVTAHSADASKALTLKDAVQSIATHPALTGLSERAKALAEVPAQVSTLPDPRFNFNILNVPLNNPSLSREAMTQTQVGLTQALPYPGKLALRAKSADFVAQAALLDVAEIRLVLQRNIHMYWWNLVYVDQALRIVQRNQSLLRQFVRIADSKYKTGQGLQSDVLLAQLELSKLLDSEISLKGTRRDQQAALNTLMQRRADAQITLPATISEQLNTLPDESLLRTTALASRPWLDAQRKHIDAAKARVELAKKDYYPDFSLGGNYGMRAGRSDLTGIMFSMNLPIFTDTKQDRALAQREADTARATFALEDRRLTMETDISQSVSDYQTATRQALLFKTGIIPQATQTVASMLAGYQVNKVDFLNLVRSQITSYNYETQYWKAISTANQALARLEAAVGTPIQTIKDQP